MSSPTSKTGLGGKFFGHHGKVFVGPKLPFVWSKCPLAMPFIDNNTPSIRSGGFTLIELVVTLAVAAIIITAAIPGLRTFIQNGRVTTQTNDLIADVSMARSEAIKRGSNVGICPANAGGTACVAGSWTGGRIIFIDINGDGNFDAGDQVLRYRELLPGGNTLIDDGSVAPPFFFGSRGMPLAVGGGNELLFTLCDDRGPSKGRLIHINQVGQLRIDSAPPASCT